MQEGRKWETGDEKLNGKWDRSNERNIINTVTFDAGLGMLEIFSGNSENERKIRRI